MPTPCAWLTLESCRMAMPIRTMTKEGYTMLKSELRMSGHDVHPERTVRTQWRSVNWRGLVTGLGLSLVASLAGASLEPRTPAGLTAAPSTGAGPGLTPTGMRFNVCCYTTSIVQADLNGDGRTDLVTGNGMSYDLSVLLNDGAGGYVEPVNYPVGAFELSLVVVAIGDVNDDGHPDIAAAGYSATEILIYLGDGTGTFAEPTSHSAGNGQFPTAIELVDIDGDDMLDIVTSNGDSNNVSVLAGQGDGSFAAANNFATGAFPRALAVADANGDGHLDIATGNFQDRNVAVLAGDGAGQFAAPVTVGIGPDAEPMSLALADVTGDGHVDIVTANGRLDSSPFPPPELVGTVSVIAGDGAGGFAAAEQHSAGAGEGRAQSIAIGDITGDGIIDIVVSRPIANRVSILAGTGDGDFAGAIVRPTGVGPQPLLLADANGDGTLDVVVANAVGASVSILPGDGEGGIGFDGNFDVGVYPHSVVAADFDGDGQPDIATADAQSGSVSVLNNAGSGTFASSVQHAVGNSPLTIATGDVNGDGSPDLVTANGSGTVSVLISDGDGGFAPSVAFPVAEGFQSPYAVALGDANGDGHLDIATANNNIQNESISFLLGDGTGDFATGVVHPVGPEPFNSPQGIVMADVTGDDQADIVTANLGTNSLSLLVGDGEGGFAAPVALTADSGPVAVAVGDVNGDGHPDIVSLNHPAQTVSMLAGDGAGGFAAAMHFPIYPPQSSDDFNAWAWGLALADVTGDGHLDIVTANTQNDSVSLLPNDGSGGFGTFHNFGTGAHPGSVAVADIDGDGRADVITGNRQNNNVSVLFNRGEGDDVIFANGFD